MRGPSDSNMVSLVKTLEDEFNGFELEHRSILRARGSMDPNYVYDRSRLSAVTLCAAVSRPPLFDFQYEVKEKIVCFGSKASGKRSALVSMPTGSGKTRTAVHAILELIIRNLIYNVLWVAPSRELLDQAFETFRSQWTGFRECPDIKLLPLDDFLSEEENAISLIGFSTPQLLLSKIKDSALKQAFQMVVFDEAHRSSAPDFARALELCRSPDNGNVLLGLSATPGRYLSEEIENLADIYENNLITSELLGNNPILKLQNSGILSKVDFFELHPSKLVGRAKRSSRDNWAEEDVLRVCLNIVKSAVKRQQKVLIFSQSIVQAEVIVAFLNCANIHSNLIHGTIPDADRKNILTSFSNGRYDVLVNVDLLIAGYDCPDISHVIIIRKVPSPIAFEQIVGRVVRGKKVGGTAQAFVWDFYGNNIVHNGISSYMRYKNVHW